MDDSVKRGGGAKGLVVERRNRRLSDSELTFTAPPAGQRHSFVTHVLVPYSGFSTAALARGAEGDWEILEGDCAGAGCGRGGGGGLGGACHRPHFW